MLDNLVIDIYKRLEQKRPFLSENKERFASGSAKAVESLVSEPQRRGLRASTIGGQKCDRQRWAEVNVPELAEPLPPNAIIKYQFGHQIEELLLLLVREAGYTVEGEQDELELDGVVGHRDVVINGRTCDIKSTSSFQYEKFKQRKLHEDDPFGYMDQLNFYSHAANLADDPKVTDRENFSFLVMEKSLGHICLCTYPTAPLQSLKERIQRVRSIVNSKDPPNCTCKLVPKGKSGNVGLGVSASYSPYKFFCHPNLRTFLYANGPEYLTKVVKLPAVTEVDRYGHNVTAPN